MGFTIKQKIMKISSLKLKRLILEQAIIFQRLNKSFDVE